MAHPQVQRAENKVPVVAAVFGLFFLLNVALDVLALLAAFKADRAPQVLPPDLGVGVRLLIFVIGLGVSWALGRWLYMQMVDGEFPVEESASAAQVLKFYLLLVFAGLAFLGGFSWIWQGVLLLVLILMTMFGLARLLGTMLTAGVILGSMLLGALLFLALA